MAADVLELVLEYRIANGQPIPAPGRHIEGEGVYMVAAFPSGTDLERIKAMKDEDIDFTDIPRADETFFDEAILWPDRKK